MIKASVVGLFIGLLLLLTSTAGANPKFYGYWGTAMTGSGSGNYIAHSARNHSNTVMIKEIPIAPLRQKLTQARAHRQKVILMVENIFYPWASSELRPDYQRRFETYWNNIREFDDIIVGFYVFDEPYHKNKNNPRWLVKASDATIRTQLNTVGSYLKRQFPNKHTFITFTYETVASSHFASQLLPTEIEAIGVNCYFTMRYCTEGNMRNLVNKLNSVKTRSQKLILTADGYYHSKPTTAVDISIRGRIRFWRNLAADYPDTLAFFPFLLQSDQEERLHGLLELPQSLAEVGIYFQSLQNKLSCQGDDLVRSQNGAFIGRWVKAPMCVPSCEGRDYVRRSALGKRVDTWRNAPLCR